MNKRYCDKYRISTTRLKNWNYSWNGAYFITICTYKKELYLGTIRDCRMILSEAGKIAARCWKKIPEHFPFVKLDSFVIMPNHIHGVLIIDKSYLDLSFDENIKSSDDLFNKGQLSGTKNVFGPQSRNLASVIRGVKVGVKKYTGQGGNEFAWQRGYYDHLIKDRQSYDKIIFYINRNPENWNKDKLNPAYIKNPY